MKQFPRRPGGDCIEAVICQADRADRAGQDIVVPEMIAFSQATFYKPRI